MSSQVIRQVIGFVARPSGGMLTMPCPAKNHANIETM
jgi:hypothetical protein